MGCRSASVWMRGAMGAGAIALFFAYAWLGLVAPRGIWSSPDEAAVAFFAERGLASEAPWARELGGLVHPRSVTVVDGRYVPSSWTGLPWLMRALATVGIPIAYAWLLVPLAAVAAVFAWGDTVRRWSGDARLGAFAGAFLAVHPGWWHYTARALHPNVLFVALLIFGAWAMTRAVRASSRRTGAWMAVGGLCVGTALFVRANEAIWVVPLLVTAGVWTARRLPRRAFIALVAAFLLPIVLMGAVHTSLYGRPWASGYSVASDPIPGMTVVAGASSPNASAFDIAFPFGVHELNIARNAWNFHAAFFWPWTVLALFGVVVVAVRWRQGRAGVWERRVLVAGGIVSAYLLAQYGSWNFHDNPDPSRITIGTSYIRYWLPVTVWMTALGAGAWRALERHARERMRTIASAVLVAAIVTMSVWTTVYGKDEGLLALRASLERASLERAWLVSHTHADDLLVVDRADKYAFPSRAVIVPLRDELTYATLRLAFDAVDRRGASLWYYGLTLPPQDVEHLRAVRLAPLGLDIEIGAALGDHTLYRIVHRLQTVGDI